MTDRQIELRYHPETQALRLRIQGDITIGYPPEKIDEALDTFRRALHGERISTLK